jgi:hypothetical protein
MAGSVREDLYVVGGGIWAGTMLCGHGLAELRERVSSREDIPEDNRNLA